MSFIANQCWQWKKGFSSFINNSLSISREIMWLFKDFSTEWIYLIKYHLVRSSLSEKIMNLRSYICFICVKKYVGQMKRTVYGLYMGWAEVRLETAVLRSVLWGQEVWVTEHTCLLLCPQLDCSMKSVPSHWGGLSWLPGRNKPVEHMQKGAISFKEEERGKRKFKLNLIWKKLKKIWVDFIFFWDDKFFQTIEVKSQLYRKYG